MIADLLHAGIVLVEEWDELPPKVRLQQLAAGSQAVLRTRQRAPDVTTS
jgi:hypothetical protein